MNKKIEERKKRWVRFTEKAGEPFMFTVSWKGEVPEGIWPNRNYRERIDWGIRYFEAQTDHLEVIDDDMVPCLNPKTGTEIFAEAFGCHVERPDDNMPYARPMLSDPREIPGLKIPGLFDTPLAKVIEIGEKLREACGPDAVMRLPDIQSPMGIGAIILDKAAFLTGLIDAPGMIRELAGKTMKLLTEFLDEWYRRFGTDLIAHFPEYYLNQGITLSEDEIGTVSNEMFEEFFLPDLISLSERYGGFGMHCCADAKHHWPSLLKIPNFRLLNLSLIWLSNPHEDCREAFEFFAGKIRQFHNGLEYRGEPEERPLQVPPNAGAVFNLTVENKEKAIETAKRLGELRERTK